MAFRQYVGARYVPLYDGTWDATKKYEPLTIVDDANGNSYTSKKDVPAGVPLTNREYWIQTASFSGAVTQLQNRMNNAESAISEHDTEIQGLTSDINRIDQEIENIRPSDKCVIFVGDSYNEDSSYAYDTWGALCVSYLAASGQRGFSIGASSCGFNPRNGANYQFSKLLQDNIDRLPFPKKDVTDVVVLGGCNDIVTESDILEGMRTFCALVDTHFPNAHVRIGCNDTRIQFNDATTSRIALINAYRSLPSAVGASVIGGVEYSLRRTDMFISKADQHPTASGMSVLASIVYSDLFGGNASTIIGNIGNDFTFDGTKISLPNSSMFALSNQCGEVVSLEFTRDLLVNLPTPTQVASGNNITISEAIEFTNTYYHNAPNFVAVLGSIIDNNTEYTVPISILMNRDKVSFVIRNTTPAVRNVSGFIIPRGTRLTGTALIN